MQIISVHFTLTDTVHVNYVTFEYNLIIDDVSANLPMTMTTNWNFVWINIYVITFKNCPVDQESEDSFFLKLSGQCQSSIIN